MGRHRDELYSIKLSAGKRIYYVDLNETVEGDKYIRVVEAQPNRSEKFRRSTVMIFEENLAEFVEAINDVYTIMKLKSRELPPTDGSEDFHEFADKTRDKRKKRGSKRHKQPQQDNNNRSTPHDDSADDFGGADWSKNEDRQLIALFESGEEVGEMVRQLDRTRGDIETRLRKLGFMRL